MKKCYRCGEEKNINRFSKSNKHISGINNVCKKCRSATVKRSYRKKEEEYMELTQKELDAKILYMEAKQAEWYREDGEKQSDNQCFYKLHAKLFWDKVERRYNDTTTRDQA